MQNKKKKETSKILIFAIMATYFIGFFIGLYVVLRILLITPEYSVQALIAMYSYIGVPVTAALGFYFNSKTKENLHKYPQATYINEYLYDDNLINDSSTDIKYEDEEDPR